MKEEGDAREYLVLSAMGEDRVGLVEELSDYIVRCRCNIEDSRMALLGGEFSIIMLLSGSGAAMADLRRGADALGEAHRLSLRLKETRSPEAPRGQTYKLETVSPDSEGLVHQLTAVLKKHDANIEDMRTQVTPAPWTGTPMFHIKGTVTLPSDANYRDLREDLIRLEGEKELDIFLKPLR